MMKRIIIHSLKLESRHFVVTVQEWTTQSSLAEFENLLAGEEVLAKKMGQVSLKNDEEALYANKSWRNSKAGGSKKSDNKTGGHQSERNTCTVGGSKNHENVKKFEGNAIIVGRRLSYEESRFKVKEPLELIHLDVFGPVKQVFIRGMKDMVSFIDDFLRLKQAPRAWYGKIAKFLTHGGYLMTSANSSLFIKAKEIKLVVVLVWSDELLLQNPKKSHLEAVCQILIYYKSALGYGIMFKKGGDCRLVGYSDVDYASNHDTCTQLLVMSLCLGLEQFLGVVKDNRRCLYQRPKKTTEQ
ncbi:hypothetical protein Sango_1723500 [Sesamum angolense]|uniref:Reverse transcriptase Ty1/copia-type domain-containing protein n=1 Tax=Sesamum angolense TaxID=2727404 RepID=A0AAE1WLM4_9LAMI|nr:hypothetical protein Sango_1723500 [Sesamum angolense]